MPSSWWLRYHVLHHLGATIDKGVLAMRDNISHSIIAWIVMILISVTITLVYFAGSKVVENMQQQDLEHCFEHSNRCEMINGKWYPAPKWNDS